MGCHHKLEQYMDNNVAATGIAEDKKGSLFRTAIGQTGKLSERPISHVDAWYVARRRVLDAGIEKAIGNHSFRAIGITDYLERGGDINIAKRKAVHPTFKTTELYDRRGDEVSFSEKSSGWVFERRWEFPNASASWQSAIDKGTGPT